MSEVFRKQSASDKIIEYPGVGILLAASTSLPADGVSGYAPGASYYVVNGAAGSQQYINEGTKSSCAFRPDGGFGGGRGSIVVAGATLTLTQALHRGKTIGLAALAGSVVTLPAATGSGDRYNFMVSVLATSNSHIVQVANANDFMVGGIQGARTDSGNAVLGFYAANSGTVATNSDTITLNRTTTGSVNVGEQFSLIDVSANTWQVTDALLSATGAAFASPFSAAV